MANCSERQKSGCALCSAERERDGVMGGLGGEISWFRKKNARGSGNGLKEVDYLCSEVCL